MFIEVLTQRKMVEVWATDLDDFTGFKEPFPDETYQHIDNWCLETFGYNARSAYNRFSFKKQKHLTMFILRWQ